MWKLTEKLSNEISKCELLSLSANEKAGGLDSSKTHRSSQQPYGGDCMFNWKLTDKHKKFVKISRVTFLAMHRSKVFSEASQILVNFNRSFLI